MRFLEQGLDGNNQAWKYILVIVVGFVLGQLLGAIPFLYYAGQSGTQTLDFVAMGLDPNFGLVLMILPFMVSFLLCYIFIKWLHRRGFQQVVNGSDNFRWTKVWYAAGVWSVLMVIYLLFEYSINSENFIFQLNWTSFLPLVVVAILLIPIQTTFEEYILRGYFAQGIVGLTKSRWVAVLVPGLVFALLHAFNPEVEAHGFWVVMPQYITFGFLFGLIAILDDGIELAMGAHAANNVFLALFLTNKDSVLQTPAILEQLEINPMRDTITLIVLSIVFFFVLKKKYDWNMAILKDKVTV
ncbi:MAG: CPBP family intramembrane glutamic endopeptidase [Reichenbachiella sp.]|uniref:CPBP family intramembrane glutamic endopeptidase n=1 Tax=Reichenbachiella sp. TaxID=2184521 RepID=UPI002967797D|nr:CPBP family intramembrane glutamic endopeptidase [Reichenbachiella sp.]MDW3209260.1 CPBP family intramembrane glutamic endopeptidase [Reichenbachiella sp.]